METKKSSINRQLGLQIKREQSVGMTVKELSAKTGISEPTINRMWSKNPRDINITQLTWLAALLGTTPQKLVEDALEKAGGLGAVMAELHDSLSEAAGNKDDLETRRLQKEAEQMSLAEIEESAIAATTDPERRIDEDPAP